MASNSAIMISWDPGRCITSTTPEQRLSPVEGEVDIMKLFHLCNYVQSIMGHALTNLQGIHHKLLDAVTAVCSLVLQVKAKRLNGTFSMRPG
jgi:hypothetical protein